MTTITPHRRPTTLDPELLERCRQRAAQCDRTNTFFHDDFDELREAGYLLAAVPAEFGGWDLDLAQVGAIHRDLARHAPATALALSMHLYWTGMAADLWRFGDHSCAWILVDAAEGHVFAAGHAESGNDLPVVLSTSIAEPADGGYRFHGRKHFGSLSPVWTRLGIHATDITDPEAPMIVHGFVERGASGATTVETWDTLGMRATQSHDTVLDGCFVPDDRIGRIVPAGDDSDPFLALMNIWALTLIANVYTGLAERAMELAVDSAQRKTSIAIERGTYAHHPMIQHRVSEMYLQLDATRVLVDRLAADWVAGVDHGTEWGPKVLSAKWHAAEGAKRVVDIALDIVGGAGMFTGNELERLYRDVRCGGFHPGNHAFAHEFIGKTLLGVADAVPRW
jgi:alkylation response protein AidB-like acyl-CoA dehydrogenase